jgi:hypothetical protein
MSANPLCEDCRQSSSATGCPKHADPIFVPMTTPSEAEVRLLAEALRKAWPYHDGWDNDRKQRFYHPTLPSGELAAAILATGLHVVTDEQVATLDALARLPTWWSASRLPGRKAEYGIIVGDITRGVETGRGKGPTLAAAIDAAMKDPQP